MTLNALFHLHIIPLLYQSSSSTLPIYSSYPLHTHYSVLSSYLIAFSCYLCCSGFSLSYIFIKHGSSLSMSWVLYQYLMMPWPSMLLLAPFPSTMHLFLSPLSLMNPIIFKSHLSVHVCVRLCVCAFVLVCTCVRELFICQRHIQTWSRPDTYVDP